MGGRLRRGQGLRGVPRAGVRGGLRHHHPGLPLPENLTQPMVTGQNVVGQDLSCTPGDWIGASSFTYQWYRSSSILISGATSDIYSITNEDYEKVLHCRVRANNSSGYADASSNSVGPVGLPYLLGIPAVSPAWAVSLRRLRSDSWGTADGVLNPVIRLKETGGNTEQTFSVIGSHTDQAAVSGFCSSNDGIAVKWYNQLSVSETPVLAGSSVGPRIVVSGEYQTKNDRPILLFSASGAQFSESISNVDVLLLAVLQPTSASGFNNIVFGTYNPTTSNQAGNMGVTYNPSNNTASVTVNANIGPSVLFTNNLNVFYLLRRGEYIKVRSGGGSSAQTHTFTLNANSFGLGSAWITDIKSLTGYASEFIAFIGSIPADDEIEEMVENMKLFWGAD